MEPDLIKLEREIEKAGWKHELVKISHLVAWKEKIEQQRERQPIQLPIPKDKF